MCAYLRLNLKITAGKGGGAEKTIILTANLVEIKEVNVK